MLNGHHVVQSVNILLPQIYKNAKQQSGLLYNVFSFHKSENVQQQSGPPYNIPSLNVVMTHTFYPLRQEIMVINRIRVAWSPYKVDFLCAFVMDECAKNQLDKSLTSVSCIVGLVLLLLTCLNKVERYS